MKLRELPARRPLWSYFLLAFLVAWGGIVIVVGPAGLVDVGPPKEWQYLPVFGAMLLGPALGGLLLTYLVGGRPGLRELWTRQRRWRVSLRWYGIALLTTPVLVLVILGGLSVSSPSFVPRILVTDDVLGVVAVGLVVGLLAGFVEEVGWTGFALPRLRRRHNLLVAGIVLGLIWGVWHGMADYWGAGAQYADLWLPRIALWTAALTAYRVLMARVYEHTRSLFVAQLMHASFTGSQAVLVPPVSTSNFFVWYSLFVVSLWAVVLVLWLSRWSRASRDAGAPAAEWHQTRSRR